MSDIPTRPESVSSELVAPRHMHVPELGQLALIDRFRIKVNQANYKNFALKMSQGLDTIGAAALPDEYYDQDKTMLMSEPAFWGFITPSESHGPQLALRSRQRHLYNYWQTYETTATVNDPKNRLVVVNYTYNGSPHHGANVTNKRTASRGQVEWLTSLITAKFSI